MHLLNSPLYHGFVAPSICEQLVAAGLTTFTPFQYIYKNGMVMLSTHAFDKVNYYTLEDKDTDVDNLPDKALPAYQLNDVEKALPGFFLLSRTENGYELICEKIYGLPAQTASRIPDLFALMLLQSLQDRVISPRIANSNITKTC